jgi:lipopolysaccharide biosynthesis glycosyltransferase
MQKTREQRLAAFLCAQVIVGLFLLAILGSKTEHFQKLTTCDESDAILPTAPQQPDTLNVLYGVQGTRDGHLIDEIEVSLKSVLMNAPLDASLHVHILTDNEAHSSLKQRLSCIQESSWRNKVVVSIYNVENYHEEWTNKLSIALRGHALDRRVNLGGYYRLLAYQILPPSVKNVVYMDVDSVVLNNLNGIFPYMNTKSALLFQWSGEWPCSGFMVLNMQKFEIFWDILSQLPMIESGGDQRLLLHVAEHSPHLVGALPSQYDIHMGHKWRKKPHLLFHENEVSMLHFNGVKPSFFANGLMKYCSRTSYCSRDSAAKEQFLKSWGLADYYVRLNWRWVIHFGKNTIRPHERGHALEVHNILIASNGSSILEVEENPIEEMNCGCKNSCNATVLMKRSKEFKFTCKDRIQYLMKRYGNSETEACSTAVQNNACGAECDPARCTELLG